MPILKWLFHNEQCDVWAIATNYFDAGQINLSDAKLCGSATLGFAEATMFEEQLSDLSIEFFERAWIFKIWNDNWSLLFSPACCLGV